MVKAKIAVLVSGGGTNFQAILDAEDSKIIKNGEVVLVISNNPRAFALKRAEKHNIPCAIISLNKSESNEKFEELLKNELKEHDIDIIVLAGFMKILSKNFIKDYPKKIINIHPSLIPSFCGKGYYGIKVHEEVLKSGVKVTGATVHYVNEIPDGGEIIMQKQVQVEIADTPEILQRRVMEEAEWIILPLALEKVSKELVGGK